MMHYKIHPQGEIFGVQLHRYLIDGGHRMPNFISHPLVRDQCYLVEPFRCTSCQALNLLLLR